ncbi:MAG TPA: hypothetical protein VMP67_10560 [Candidatus Limnocylindria bacterium]|nr:hypothetical protein [Candidatus Limnocylindria bacterium]
MSTPTTERDWTVVWIDSREAFVACWHAGRPTLERLQSDVPEHHRASGHVRRQGPMSCSGGPPRRAGESHRLEHIRRFLQLVSSRLPPSDSLTIIGPGSMAARLGGLVRECDRQQLRSRPIRYRRAARLTDAQLLAELRAIAHQPRPRQTLGAHRWSAELPPTMVARRRLPGRAEAKADLEPLDDWFENTEELPLGVDRHHQHSAQQ